MNIKEKPPDYMKCVKVPIKHILKHLNISLPKITNTVILANKIVIHTLQFMKLYILDYYNKNNKLPEINKKFINSCMKIQCDEKQKGRPPSKNIKKLKEELNLFYQKEYKILTQNEKLTYTHMNTILDYLTIDILTMYENNIKLHYIEYLERYVNVIWKKKFLIEKIKKLNLTKKEKDKRINNLCNQLRKIKNDLLNVDNKEYKSKSFYHSWITNNKKILLPDKNKFKKNNLYYDIQCSPQEYLPSMIFMMKEIEKEGFSINNVFPQRNDVVPKHIRLDTTTLVHLLMTNKQGKKSDYLFKGNLKRNEDKIWKFFFRTERQCFHKNNYTFHHMMETDGVGCSILFLRNDLIGKRINFNKSKKKETYIDEVKDYAKLKDKKIVAIDPGKCDLIYCVDGDNTEANVFRHSQDRRRKETRSKKYGKLILKLKEENKEVIKYETELSKFNRKTLDINEYKKYVKKKNEINGKLFDFYKNYIFRKLKLNGYFYRLKSEQNLINNFKKIFGSSNNIIICFGDYEQRKHMKFKEPVKGRGFRTLFRKNGFETYLVDEFRTSCKCSKCEGGSCEKFMVRENPKPFRDNLRLVHGLLSCKNCANVWNRDCNGAKNIYKIAFNSIRKKERPNYLCRSNKSGVLHDTSKSKFTRLETVKPSMIFNEKNVHFKSSRV
jgi:hypothetical protein